jgi:UDP-N-acetylglucosamine 2-epimerase (non-hydrolysing)
MTKFNVSVVLGIRPDYIRTSKVLKLLKSHPELNATFISTGQHYDRELKGVFLEQLGLPEPDITLDTKGETHCEQHSKLILQLEKALLQTKPDVVLFLGDANAVIGCIVPLKMGIPIAHIEAGMRSYNWQMPEERNRVIIDRVSDVLYVYHNNYKCNLVREGINPSRIEVVGNVIVDVLNDYKAERWNSWFNISESIGLEPKTFALMTMHRNENVSDKRIAQEYLDAVDKTCQLLGIDEIYLPEMPRLAALNLTYPEGTGRTKFIRGKPLGFFEYTAMEENAAIEFTDSGTNQEVAAILGTPCVVLRRCTERPECFDSGINELAEPDAVFHAARNVMTSKRNRDFSLGDGRASERIVEDLVKRLKRQTFELSRRQPHIDRDILSHMI